MGSSLAGSGGLAAALLRATGAELLGKVRDFLVEGLLAAGEILELVGGRGGGLIGQGIGEGLLGLFELLELFDEVVHLGLMGLGGGFLQLRIVLDQLIELFFAGRVVLAAVWDRWRILR